MRIRIGFVSNSSSTAFIITNTSKRSKTMQDFVAENPGLIEDFKSAYGYEKDEAFTQEKLLESAKKRDLSFKPGEEKWCVFGDEEGDLIGHVFDYILRAGGESKSFRWKFDKFLR